MHVRTTCNRVAATAFFLVIAGSCADSATSPFGPIHVRPLAVIDTAVRGEPGEFVKGDIEVVVRSLAGRPVSGVQVTWTTQGTGSYVVATARVTDADGVARARWQLGTNAALRYELSATAAYTDGQQPAVFTALAVPTRVHMLRALRDSIDGEVGDTLAVAVDATDPYGNHFIPDSVEWFPVDTTRVKVASDGRLILTARGAAAVVLRCGGAADTIAVHVRQIVARIVAPNSVTFTSLGEARLVSFGLLDKRGLAVSDSVPSIHIADSAVVRTTTATSFLLQSAAEGVTTVRLAVGTVVHEITVVVRQRAVALSVDERLYAAPRDVRIGDSLDLGVRGTDALGNVILSPSVRVEPDTVGVVDHVVDGQLRITGSGWVDLRITSADVVLTRRLRVYVSPELTERESSSIQLVGLPDTVNPWAPTLVSAPNGTTRLYFGGYKPSPADNVDRADLDYFESTDGKLFTYQGVALPHAPNVTDAYGWGIENIAIVARNDGSGYRMFFSAGSTRLGWQVFSAVGDGVSTWTPEPGVRLPNDGGNSPEGEGMVVLPRAGGGYRMIEGSMVVTKVASGSWQIVEYESNNQLNWTFRREHLAQGIDGEGTARAVYSPSIVRFGRGVYRMFYTGDNFRVNPAPQSNMWSAVSFDLENWLTEGAFIVAGTDNVMYASALGDRVAYVLSPCGGCRGRLAIASIRQR